MKLGECITVTQVYRRCTRYRPTPSYHYNQRCRIWEAREIAPRQAIFLGYRTLRNGSSEWEDEVGYVFEPDTDSHIRAALVCFSTRENPVYVPMEATDANNR